ncbi:hypothetical protein K488DRAFT_86903 [Vararia minispora EC-137]|uniref:Uncharacterized protein n=1 Tax=Vararia minispora EC-137 TaxID=1314806 RepID=A0ACB8QI65_9AGAM|nr:hypothetical protein K488DRAFT_86903 [Vararia minispora EC-137]
MKPARFILARCNQEKGKAHIEEATGFRGIELRLVDLSKFASVNEFAAKPEDEGLALDIFVYNAGFIFALRDDCFLFGLLVNDFFVLLLGALGIFSARVPKDTLNSLNIMRKLNDPKSFKVGPSKRR